MTDIGKPERATQNRVIGLFRDEQDNRRFKLDKYLLKICAKMRLIELMHDFLSRARSHILAVKKHLFASA